MKLVGPGTQLGYEADGIKETGEVANVAAKPKLGQTAFGVSSRL
jgi:hypothetical protein